MFKYKLSNGQVVTSFDQLKLVEYSEWGGFVLAEAAHAAAKATLEVEWEAYSASHEALSPEAYVGSAIQQAYREHRRAVLALPQPVFVGEEPLPQGPVQGFVPQIEWREHAAYGGWDLRKYRKSPAVRLARLGDAQVYSEADAWKIAGDAVPRNDYVFSGDAVGSFDSREDICVN